MNRLEKLKELWGTEELPPGVSPEDIAEFEKRHQVVFPKDLKEYFLYTNGMTEDIEWDDECIYFWPLQEVKSIAEEIPDRPDRFFESTNYFLFADYLTQLFTFAIRMSADPGEPNQIIRLDPV